MGFYATIPANILHDRGLPPRAILLYGELTSLANKEGYCFASNDFFAELYQVNPKEVTRWIKSLEEKGYIRIEYKHKGMVIDERRIYIQEAALLIRDSTEDKNVPDTNTITNKNLLCDFSDEKSPPAKSKRFIKPTVEDIRQYCIERKNNVDAERFFDYYESKGWTVGKSGMKDWRASVRLWERNGINQSESKPDDQVRWLP